MGVYNPISSRSWRVLPRRIPRRGFFFTDFAHDIDIDLVEGPNAATMSIDRTIGNSAPSLLHTGAGGDRYWNINYSACNDYVIEADVRFTNIAASYVAIAGRYELNNFYCADLRAAVAPWNQFQLTRRLGGGWVALATVAFVFAINTWYHVTLTMNGNQISASLNETTLGPVVDANIAEGELMGARCNVPLAANAHIDNLLARNI